MNHKLASLILFICLSVSYAQQRPDLDFEPKIDTPKYSGKTTAIIGIDASHNNFHKLEGGFAPFAKLMKADGYKLISISKITAENLAQLNTFVIVNPIHSSNVGNWKKPIANAFSSKEIEIIENWVKQGGSLLVIADHMPFAGATDELAKAFGFYYEDGFVINPNQGWPPDTYSKKQSNLFETAVTKNIDSIAGFTGSALKTPKEAIKIASFPKTHKLLVPDVAWQFESNTKELELTNYCLGAILDYAEGKVAFFTEAAMFTAQIVRDQFKVGFNSPRAPQNIQFVLNVIHWLDSGKTTNRKAH